MVLVDNATREAVFSTYQNGSKHVSHHLKPHLRIQMYDLYLQYQGNRKMKKEIFVLK